ncbi:sigma-70 family RNA polymerase sigma factor [uncultured Tyzzerella sp.]|uniref:RNA polymerase sigma factor n=1 Tax=uncultured Tyzzerella sp. TaxID=2321398 RepID=UPI0029437CD0|nr:sigma-70 family RNA polymerase sigma factor [uncultured Tyzzerella sp.]
MRKNKVYLIEETLLKNYNKYYKLAFSYVHNDTDAMDIVQESAYKAIKNAESLKDKRYVDTWIYKIVINQCKTFLSKNSKITDDIEDVNITFNDKYENIDLKNALNSLDDDEKAIIILRFFEDLKIEDIANILDIKVNTVKSRLYRCLRKLEDLMEGYRNGA